LKTHRKAGLTGALKNLVGFNGDKDFLPHHRVGGSANGGDCYEGHRPLKRVAERFLDQSNQRLESRSYGFLKKTSDVLVGLNRLFFKEDEMEGGWYGNDTIWRMVLDLNSILLYGQSDGTLASKPVRKLYSLTDGLIAGEGFGPLAPEPVRLGVVTFASNSAFADLVHCGLLRFDWRCIPLIRCAFGKSALPLARHRPEEVEVYVRGERLALEDLAVLWGIDAAPARGWVGHIEDVHVRQRAELSTSPRRPAEASLGK
jgi:hypothetical protein